MTERDSEMAARTECRVLSGGGSGSRRVVIAALGVLCGVAGWPVARSVSAWGPANDGKKRPMLQIDIARSMLEKESSSGIGIAPGDEGIRFTCTGKRLESIVCVALSVSPQRLEIPEAVANQLYDVTYMDAPEGRKASMWPLLNAFGFAARVKIAEVRVEREVWVAKGSSLRLVDGTGDPRTVDEPDGTFRCFSFRAARFFGMLEKQYQVVIEDELAVDKSCDWVWNTKWTWDELVSQMQKTRGIELVKERRSVRMVQVTEVPRPAEAAAGEGRK